MSHAPDNEKPELFRKFLMALAFSALGYCGNYLSIQVAFSVDFIFGSIFVIFAVATLGLWWGIGVSFIASSYTYLLWNHPYAIIIFTAEIIWIGLALKRGKKNILLIDSLYWLILGIPLVIVFYSGLQQLDTQIVVIITLKQAVNGIFNAMVASIILSHTPLHQWMLGKKSTRLPTYSTIIFHLIAVSLMFPSLSLLLYMNHREVASQQSQAVESVQANAYKVRAFIQAWVGNYVNAVQVIADLGEKYPLRPSPELQKELIQIRKLFPDYHNVFLGDADATTIAFDPPVNELGESTIGINFADRAWFKQLKNTLKPVVSDVFMGRGGIFSPIFTISVPVVHDGKLVWFGLGAVNLKELKDHLVTFSHGVDLSLVDQSGNVIVSTNKNKKPLMPFDGTNNGTIVAISSNVSLWVPGTVKNVSIMNVWKGAYYFTRLPLDETDWILVTENPVKPMQKYLYKLTIWGMGEVAVLYALSMLLALLFSRRLSGSIETLSTITKDIPLKIDKPDMIVWPHMATVEMEQLTNNFKDTESALRKYVQEVQERTWELQNERQRLGDILYGTNSGTWEWNVQTGEASFNERWANIFGYDLHELEPISIQTWIDFTHPDDLKVSNEILEKHFKREIDYYECECRMKHKDGSWVWVLNRGKVVSWTEDSKPLTMSGTHQDITRRKQTEAELMKSEQQLQQVQKAESLGRMAGAIAHNFNNQLSVVLGNLELALDDLPSDTKIHRFLIAAMKAVHRSSEISGLMLTYLGQSTVKLESLDLSEVCRHDLPFLQDIIHKNITLKTYFMASGPVVAANANQVRMVLTHLITNATESIGDRNGEITLKIRTIPVSDIPKIHITPIDWKPDADIFACLEVKDTGYGISDQDMNKIFDPFFTTKFIGRGLGLPVVLGIVKTWKGAVSVESRKGHGSTFCVFLPLVTDEIFLQPEKVTEADKIEGNCTVLLVEDQDLVRKMAGAILNRLGFSVLEAADGIEAIEIFTQHREEIRCVITDLTMPGMDGWETFTALRRIQPDLPVILVSGYDEAQAMEHFDSEKPQAFLRKPYSKDEMKNALNAALGGQG